MKHLIKKNIFQGGGKSQPRPKPPILKPPKLGNFEVLNSFSVAEIVDLISDGPIEGLVNQNGQTLGLGKSVLQGVYLDNTPVELTSELDSQVFTDGIASTPISSTLRLFGDRYINSASNTYYKYTAPDIKFLQERLLICQTFNVFTKKQEGRLYSPLIDNTIPNSGNGWTFDDYAYNTGSKSIELHINNTLFNPNSLLDSLSKSLNIDLNKKNTNKYQKQFIKKSIEQINNLKSTSSKMKLDFKKENKVLIVVQIGTRTSPVSMSFKSGVDKSIFDENGKLEKTSFAVLNFDNSFPQSNIYKVLVPKVSANNRYTGEVYGCLVFDISTTPIDSQKFGSGRIFSFLGYQTLNNIIGFAQRNVELLFKKGAIVKDQQVSKYNFLNVSCEFKNGEEYQNPLTYFKNSYIDYPYGSEMFGPFALKGTAQRIYKNWGERGSGPQNPTLNISLTETEGSNDIRFENASMADWNNANIYEEKATPVVHTIENPNVNSVFFTLGISQLSDTQQRTQDGRDAGEKIPAIVKISVEWGKVSNGIKKAFGSKKYAVLALVEGQMLVDFGSPDLKQIRNQYKSVRDISTDEFKEGSIYVPYTLPPIEPSENPTSVKRYIQVTKLSTETNSVLLRKEISLQKVTEVIENNFSYPFSSIVGVKFDARSFGSVPERTYDCRLKKIKIPVNYKPLLQDGKDKRYLTSASDYQAQELKNHVYDGDWDGSFKVGWTDNPAWILYDLLTSKRYGLGGYIDESQINKWELYKIGRFCDAVNEEGYFDGVSDGVGGLEPRYSCNIVFRDQTKIFDAINIVANLFRGSVFFSNSEIHFLDDRPRTPIAAFTNSNVKDGFFNYINNRRDQQFNTVEVAYIDRLDNYQTKIEYVQDESDIRKRGVFKTTINTLGVTSRAMARRIGQHVIYQTIKENQSVEFSAGLESLLCRPGDLVIVEDELKTRSSNYGRILSIDTDAKSLRLENQFESSSFDGKITVYTPTGYTSSAELEEIANINRSRIPYFDVTGNLLDSNDSILTGRYGFSGYAVGFPTGNLYNLPQQFPVYTGEAASGHDLFCFYSTGATGFIFATGLAYQNSTVYNKVITNTGVYDVVDILSANSAAIAEKDDYGFRYKTTSNFRNSPSGSLSGKLKIDFDSYNGILESEITTTNYPQITTFNLTGFENLDYGSEVFIDQSSALANLVPLIAEGSAYRIQRTNASDQIYKIITIKEISQNEYSVVATKYDTGKFEEIENFITEDYLPETFYSGPPTINNVNILQLAAPVISSFTTGVLNPTNFSLTGSWSPVTNAQGYDVQVYNEITNEYFYDSLSGYSNSYYSLTGLSSLGFWNLKVQSIGNNSTFLNSAFSKTGKFVAYQTITTLDRPAVTTFTLT
jgi:hypothetical protein